MMRVPLRLALVAFPLCLPVSLYAQRDSPPPYRGAFLFVGGIFVTPVAGAPMSGTVTIHSSHYATDGSIVARMTVDHIARDDQGRIYNERRVMMPEGFQGQPDLLSAHIYDPVNGENTFLNPETRIARQAMFRGARTDAASPEVPPGAKFEEIGTKKMLGETVNGTRVTQTIASAASGTGKALQVVDEYWYSEDLHIYLSVTHNDPRTGVQTVTVSELHRGEPPASNFVVPGEYKVVDVNPPADAPVNAGR